MRMRKARLEQAMEDVKIYAKYMVDNKVTIRATADHFGINFSKLHRHINQLLPEADETLYTEVQNLINNNVTQRHLRGGEATHNKFKKN